MDNSNYNVFTSNNSGYNTGIPEINSLKASGIGDDLTGLNRIAHKLKTIVAAVMDRFMSRDLAVGTYLGPEYMAQGYLSGETSNYALSTLIELLKKTDSSSESVHKVIKTLEYAKKIEGKKIYPNMFLAKQVERDVKNLKIGENLAISSSVIGHAMLLSITCIADDNGLKTYNVVHHNTGMPHKTHKSRFENEKFRVLTALQIENVSAEKLNKNFFQSLLNLDSLPAAISKDSFEKLYDTVLPQLGDFTSTTENDIRFWNRFQMGGSCTMKCLLSFLKVELQTEEYKAFRNFSKFQIAKKSAEKIQKGWGNSTVRKIFTLETVRNLQRTLLKSNRAENTPNVAEQQKVQAQLQELSEIEAKITKSLQKKEIESLENEIKNKSKLNGIEISISVDSDNEIYSKNRLDNLNIAFYILKKYSFSPEAVKRANHFIEQALVLSPEEDLNKKEERTEVKNIIKLVSQLLKYEDALLTRDQIYLINGISAGVLKIVNENPTLFPSKKIADLKTLYEQNYLRFASLGLRKIYKKTINQEVTIQNRNLYM